MVPWCTERNYASEQGGADVLLAKQSDVKRTLHTMEQTLTELQSKYAYGIGKRLPSALRQSRASFIAIEPAGKDELALMRATHAEEMSTLRAQFRQVLSRALPAASPSCAGT
jgi:hypothetical protein